MNAPVNDNAPDVTALSLVLLPLLLPFIVAIACMAMPS